MRYILPITWLIAIGAACFVAGMLIGNSAAGSNNYALYLDIAGVVAIIAILVSVFLSLLSTSRRRRRG